MLSFQPQSHIELPVHALLDGTTVQQEEVLDGETVVFFIHPSLGAGWLLPHPRWQELAAWEAGYAILEQARQGYLNDEEPEPGITTTAQSPDLVDGIIQYLAYLQTKDEEQRDMLFPERVETLSSQFVSFNEAKQAYRWQPIPLWQLPESPFRDAVIQHRRLSIRYTNYGDGLTNDRTVQPHYVFDARTTGNRLLLSWDELRGNWRCFILDRIQLLSIGEVFEFNEPEVKGELYAALEKASEGPLDLSEFAQEIHQGAVDLSQAERYKFSDYGAAWDFVQLELKDPVDIDVYELPGIHPQVVAAEPYYVLLDRDLSEDQKEFALVHEATHLFGGAPKEEEEFPREMAERFRVWQKWDEAEPGAFKQEILRRYR